jgi:Tol biopolymer transport system component
VKIERGVGVSKEWLLFFLAMITVTSTKGTLEVKKIHPIFGSALSTTESRIGLLSDETKPVLIFNSDALSNVITLTTSGNYQLGEDLLYTVSIAASPVALNLNNHKITIASSSVHAVVINGATQINIMNGYLQGAGVSGGTGCGIQVNGPAAIVALRDMTVVGFGTGVSLLGTSTTNSVSSCSLDRIQCVSNDIGVYGNYTYATLVGECNALFSTNAGFSLANSESVCLYDCATLKSTGTATVVGFKSLQGTSNMFQRCVVKQTKTSSTTNGDVACGFMLTGTEQKTKIVDCIVNETDVVSSMTGVTFGICLMPVIQPTADVLSTVTLWTNQASSASGCAWSPNNDYVAVAFSSTSSLVNIYSFNGSSLTLTASTVSACRAAGIAWSPDGKYLAIGAGTSVTPNVYVYAFNGQALTGAVSYTGAGGPVYSVSWSLNGKYLAYADSFSTGYVRTLSFDGSTLTQISSLTVSNSGTNQIYLSWAPDGSALAVSQQYTSQPLRVIPVNANGQMGTATTFATSVTWSGMKWSHSGRYFATCDGTGNVLRVYRWNSSDTTSPITQVASIADSGGSFNAVTWSPDGNYIVASTSIFTIRLYQFSGTSLTFVKASPALNAAINTLSWTADGRYIAACSSTTASQYIILTAMYGPLNCLVGNCRVGDTLASGMNMGRGFMAGGTNLFINNVAANNGSNYSYGIPNVYSGRFQISRNTPQPFDNFSMPATL